jgi:type IV secretory pathway VirB2 component (pilin)
LWEAFWFEKVEDGLIWEKDINFFWTIEWILIFALGFLALISVIYVIWIGFRLMTSAWNEEQFKKSKWSLLYVAIGIIVIFLAYQIVRFTIRALEASGN